MVSQVLAGMYTCRIIIGSACVLYKIPKTRPRAVCQFQSSLRSSLTLTETLETDEDCRNDRLLQKSLCYSPVSEFSFELSISSQYQRRGSDSEMSQSRLLHKICHFGRKIYHFRVDMENIIRKNNALYHNITDMKRCNQLMSRQMGSPFAMRSGGYSNPKGPKLLMSSPYESYKCDDAENIDPQIAISMNSCSSSSGQNFSSPLAVNMVRYPGGYDCTPLSFVENSGNSCSASASKSPPVVVNSQLRLEDDVLVMDEVFVVNALDGRSRSEKDSNGSSESSDKSCKKDVCSSWADTRSCRFGSNGQFSHRKEDLTLVKFSNKGKPELLDVRSSKITSSTYFKELKRTDFKGHNSRPPKSCGAVSYGRSPQGLGTIGNIRGSPADGSGSGNSRGRIAPKDNRCLDWMPQDDGINARPPGSHNPSRYEVLECINNHLYAPRVKNRLPVFTAIFQSPAAAAHRSCPTN